ncbi:hypothetical protein DK419_14575 [Methylobacterium terrae]|uniref:DUF4156 domain-containing protein n=1 Tax=Methylobacterium terrae TaxID=2202827 RepID=A0A2U8WML2_9HYPH|nr:hypothetical protein [Methylobacterium terrae]AWN47389.1 hypothetical protein DK419_14575 [Methylobacterium terrae]
MTRAIARRPAGMRRSCAPLALLALSALLAGCLSVREPGDGVTLVRDLAAVRGCRFVATLGRPARLVAAARVEAYEALLVDLRRRTAATGGTHLYLLNDAAGWGAAEAIGTVYRCVD